LDGQLLDAHALTGAPRSVNDHRRHMLSQLSTRSVCGSEALSGEDARTQLSRHRGNSGRSRSAGPAPESHDGDRVNVVALLLEVERAVEGANAGSRR
jgi:hypothetical protein